jgi:GNAT superfamily N-acetyltransferase
MAPSLRIDRVDQLPLDLDQLVHEGATENFQGVERLSSDWRGGSNRFSLPGEALFVARLDRELAGVCGLNRDPFLGDSVGRLRHLYIVRAQRRQGVATALVNAILDHAHSSFQYVCLRTDRADADMFYLALGFEKTTGTSHHTHLLKLVPRSASRRPKGRSSR